MMDLTATGRNSEQAAFRLAIQAMAGLLLAIPACLLQAAPFAYVANYGSHTISVIDIASNTVSRTITNSSFFQPYGVAINAAGNRLYLSNANSVLVVDAASGTVAQAFMDSNISQARGVALNPAGTLLYSANAASNSLSIMDVDPASSTYHTILATVTGLLQPEGIVVRPGAPYDIYVTNSAGSTVSAINGGIVYANISVGSQPKGIALNPAGTRAYVANYGSGSVSVIDISSNTLVTTINGFSQPYGVAVSPDGSKAYVTNSGNMSLSVIDTGSNSITATTFGLGALPRGVTFNPAGTRAYVTNSGSGNVSVIETSGNSIVSTIAVGLTPISMGHFIGPAVSLSTSNLAFLLQMVDTTSAAQSVTLSNDGATPINITSISISGDFAQTNTCGATLAAGSSCAFSITFTPTVATTLAGSLNISSSAPNSPHTVFLSGTGSLTSFGVSASGGGGCTLARSGHADTLLPMLCLIAAWRVLLRGAKECSGPGQDLIETRTLPPARPHRQRA